MFESLCPSVCITKQQEEGAEQASSNLHNGGTEQGHAGKRASGVIVR
jgi:hypothetical protein